MELYKDYKNRLDEGTKDREASMHAYLTKLAESDKFVIYDGSADNGAWVVSKDDNKADFDMIRNIVLNRAKKAAQNAGIKESASFDVPLFTEYASSKNTGISYLNEEENIAVDEAVSTFETELGGDVNNLDEGFFGKLVGGAAGFLAGPMIGKIIARALGIEKGILYDMLTSRLVSTALGAAIGKAVTGGNKS